MTSEIIYVCRVCAEGKAVAELLDYRPVVTVEGDTTTWTCPGCGAVTAVMIDCGTLDLGLVEADRPDDFEILG